MDAVRAFYESNPYPRQPDSYCMERDPYFWIPFIEAESRLEKFLPRDGMKIWVAGCGRRQALDVALMFPTAEVLGTDISQNSLDLCEADMRKVGCTNLKLGRADIHLDGNQHNVPKAKFDLIFCTGVIHHAASPRDSLRALSWALKPSGVLQLMVYNHFHQVTPIGIRDALRWLVLEPAHTGEAIRRLVEEPLPGVAGHFLRELAAANPGERLDTLAHPRVTSYTVESLSRMATEINLEILHPFCHPAPFGWEWEFLDPMLRHRYDMLLDIERWNVTNHLLQEQSPMLWFYLQRRDSPFKRRTVAQMNERIGAGRPVGNRCWTEWHRRGDTFGEIMISPMVEAAPPYPRDGTRKQQSEWRQKVASCFNPLLIPEPLE